MQTREERKKVLFKGGIKILSILPGRKLNELSAKSIY